MIEGFFANNIDKSTIIIKDETKFEQDHEKEVYR